MCRKIRCDRKSWKLFRFRGKLNKAQDTLAQYFEGENKGAYTVMLHVQREEKDTGDFTSVFILL